MHVGVAISVEPFTAALVQAVLILLVVRMLDLWEREPLWTLAAMAVWGAVGATSIAAPLNGVVDAALSTDVSTVFGAAISAPVVEETAKGLALIAALLVSRWAARRHGLPEFSGPTDGMVYGAAIGLGFAFAENNVYFLNDTYAGGLKAGFETLELREGFWNLNTLGHAVYTAAFGAGLGLATWSRSPEARIGFPLLGLGFAMFMHAFHNGFAQLVLVERFGLDTVAAALRGEGLPVEIASDMNAVASAAFAAVQVSDYLFAAGFVLALVLWSLYQQRVMKFELAEEVDLGVVTQEEWSRLPRVFSRAVHNTRLLAGGHMDEWRAARHVDHETAELAFLKWRVRRTGRGAEGIPRQREIVRATRHQQTAVGAHLPSN